MLGQSLLPAVKIIECVNSYRLKNTFQFHISICDILDMDFGTRVDGRRYPVVRNRFDLAREPFHGVAACSGTRTTAILWRRRLVAHNDVSIINKSHESLADRIGSPMAVIAAEIANR